MPKIKEQKSDFTTIKIRKETRDILSTWIPQSMSYDTFLMALNRLAEKEPSLMATIVQEALGNIYKVEYTGENNEK